MTTKRAVRPILILFALVNLVGMSFYANLSKSGLDPDILLAGNLFVFIITVFSFWMLLRGLKAKSTTAFLSSIYGSFIIKLAVSGLLTVAYAKLKGAEMNTPAIFSSLFLYLIYTFWEIKGLLAMLRKD
jgi:hypothetical protein